MNDYDFKKSKALGCVTDADSIDLETYNKIMEEMVETLGIEKSKIEPLWAVISDPDTQSTTMEKLEDLMDMIYHETHKPEEEEEEDPLDNEDLLELLTIVSNEAFSSTDVFKVRFEQISKIVDSHIEEGKKQILEILAKLKEGNFITRVRLQDYLSGLEENALVDNLDNSVVARTQTRLAEAAIRDAELFSRPILDTISDLTGQQKELQFANRLSQQMEYIIKESEMHNISKKSPEIERVNKLMDQFNENLGQLRQVINQRYREMEMNENESHAHVKELEGTIKEMEYDLDNQIEYNHQLRTKLKETQEKVREVEKIREVTVIDNSKEAEYLSEISRYGAQVRELENENMEFESKLNQRYLEINELQSEIKNLNEMLAQAVGLEDDTEDQKAAKQEEFKNVIRASLALKSKAEEIADDEKKINQKLSNEKIKKLEKKIRELEETLDEERTYSGSLKMEVVGLRQKVEDLEDQTLLSGRGSNAFTGNRLGSNVFGSQLVLDDDDAAADGLLGMNFGRGTQIRKVRDTKCIQVDLAMANVIMEEYEYEEFEIKRVRIERFKDDVTAVTVRVQNDEGISDLRMAMDKVEVDDIMDYTPKPYIPSGDEEDELGKGEDAEEADKEAAEDDKLAAELIVEGEKAEEVKEKIQEVLVQEEKVEEVFNERKQALENLRAEIEKSGQEELQPILVEISEAMIEADKQYEHIREEKLRVEESDPQNEKDLEELNKILLNVERQQKMMDDLFAEQQRLLKNVRERADRHEDQQTEGVSKAIDQMDDTIVTTDRKYRVFKGELEEEEKPENEDEDQKSESGEEEAEVAPQLEEAIQKEEQVQKVLIEKKNKLVTLKEDLEKQNKPELAPIILQVTEAITATEAEVVRIEEAKTAEPAGTEAVSSSEKLDNTKQNLEKLEGLIEQQEAIVEQVRSRLKESNDKEVVEIVAKFDAPVEEIKEAETEVAEEAVKEEPTVEETQAEEPVEEQEKPQEEAEVKEQPEQEEPEEIVSEEVKEQSVRLKTKLEQLRAHETKLESIFEERKKILENLKNSLSESEVEESKPALEKLEKSIEQNEAKFEKLKQQQKSRNEKIEKLGAGDLDTLKFMLIKVKGHEKQLENIVESQANSLKDVKNDLEKVEAEEVRNLASNVAIAIEATENRFRVIQEEKPSQRPSKAPEVVETTEPEEQPKTEVQDSEEVKELKERLLKIKAHEEKLENIFLERKKNLEKLDQDLINSNDWSLAGLINNVKDAIISTDKGYEILKAEKKKFEEVYTIEEGEDEESLKLKMIRAKTHERKLNQLIGNQKQALEGLRAELNKGVPETVQPSVQVFDEAITTTESEYTVLKQEKKKIMATADQEEADVVAPLPMPTTAGAAYAERREHRISTQMKNAIKTNILGIVDSETRSTTTKTTTSTKKNKKSSKGNKSPKKKKKKKNIGGAKSKDLYDYVNLLKNKSACKLMQSNEKQVASTIFSDVVTRINSNCERKMRVCMITPKFLYILYASNSKGAYKLKFVAPIELITKVTVCKRNSTLIKISVQNQADQLIESFRRNSLVLFLRKMSRARGQNILLYKKDDLVFVNRHNKVKRLNIRVDEMFKPEFQDMFMVSEKTGFLKVRKHGLVSKKEEDYVLVLTNCGILCLDPVNFETKKFIPLHGTKLKDVRMSSKVDYYAVAVFYSTNLEKEIIIFGSDKEKQEWITKLLKIQYGSISR